MTDLNFESPQDSFQESRGPDHSIIRSLRNDIPGMLKKCCEMSEFQD